MIISKPSKKITMAPASANELISTLKNFNIYSPTKRNVIINIAEAIVALPELILIPLSLKSIIMGIFPKISMTEKRNTPST